LQRGTASDEIGATRSGSALRQILAIILVLRTAFAWYSHKITFAPTNNFGMGSASANILALMMIWVMAIFYMRVVYLRVTL
jgi:hypothetical protein